MTDNPYAAPMSNSSDQASDDFAISWQSVTEPLRTVTGYERFLGISLILIGVLYCLTIFGALVGWLPIWLGILFLKSADNVRNGTAASTQEGIAQLAKSIRIMGVATAFFLALMLVYIVFVVGMMLVLKFSNTAPLATQFLASEAFVNRVAVATKALANQDADAESRTCPYR